MSYADQKVSETAKVNETGDKRARQWLKKQLGGQGYAVMEADSRGPVRVLTRAMDGVTIWLREQKSDKDWLFVREEQKPWVRH